MKKNLSWIAAAVFAIWILSSLRPPKNPTEFKLDEFGRLPVLANGRIQPLDSFARNTLLSIHGTQTVRPSTNDPSQTRILSAREWILEVMAYPENADKRRIFRIESLDLRNLLGAREGRLGQLAHNEVAPKRDEIIKEARQFLKLEEETGREPQLRNGYEKDLMHLYQGMILYDRIKNAIQPADSRDFQEELKIFRETIPPALAALQEHQAGKFEHAKTNESIGLLSLFMNRYQNMTLWGHPMLAPPLEVKADRDGWSNIGTNLLLAMRSAKFHPAIDYYAAIATAWRENKPSDFNKAVSDYQGWLVQHGLGSEMSKGKAEFFFNHLEPFYKTTLIYVVALLLGAAFWLNFSPWLRKSAYGLVMLAFVLHTAGLIFRMCLEGRPPVTNLYSSAVFVGWGAVLLGIILERFYPEGIGVVTASCVGFITLIIAHNLALGGDTMEMMRAVLDTNVWLATHVVIINTGYAATSLAGFLGIIYIARGFFTRSLSQQTAKGLARMVYGTVCFATLFTFVGTVLGGLWADQSWGRFWGWDPKENGALLIVLANATLLHMRWGGMIRERGLMSAAIFGNIVTAWSWFGTNMLGVGLHSYGFMDQGFKWLVLFVGSQVAFMLIALIPLRYWRSFQSPRCSLLAASLSALIWIVFFPVWLVAVIFYEAHAVLSSRKLGVSATALSPMTMRWLQHQLGLRRDEACAKLIKVLPNHSYIGLCAVAFPVLLGHRLTGFVPKMLRYPYEGIPPVGHSSSVRATFVDAAIERYLPGVEQFVELGAGYDTRTAQLQHNRRIRCFEVDLPKTQQMKRELLHQCGVDTSGVKFVSANFLTDRWLDNLAKADFDPRKPTFFLWEGVTYYLSREAMEKTFRTIATIAPGSLVVFDYGTDANVKRYRRPPGLLAKAILKAVREPQTFWISSEPPVKKNLAALMDAYGLSLREHLNYGCETKHKRSFGGLAAAVVSDPKKDFL